MLKSLERDLQKRILLLGQFYMHVDFITFTKLSITYGSDTSGRKLGNGEQGQTPWKGELTLSGLGVFLPPERIFRTGSSGGSAQMLHLF